MSGEQTLDGWELRLFPRGPGRFVSACFLIVWLSGWALGEAFALWILVKGAIALVTGQPPDPGRDTLEGGVAGMAGGFLLLWLFLWTLGGIAAIGELLRSLWGEDRLLVSGGRLTLTRVRGPFRTKRTFEREAIRRIVTLAPHELLVLDDGTRRVELSRLGTGAERAEAAPALLRELAIPEARLEPGRALPDCWEEVVTPEGERALAPDVSTRRVQARITASLALAAAAVTFLVARDSISEPGLVASAVIGVLVTAALAVGAVRLARGRKEWRIDTGRLTLRKRYGSSARDVFAARKLVLEATSDSDGDIWYELYGLGQGEDAATAGIAWRPRRPKNSRTIDRRMNDQPAALDLAVWLAREAGLALEDRTTPEARVAELAQLLVALESSGRFGRWAAKWLDRQSERQRKS